MFHFQLFRYEINFGEEKANTYASHHITIRVLFKQKIKQIELNYIRWPCEMDSSLYALTLSYAIFVLVVAAKVPLNIIQSET